MIRAAEEQDTQKVMDIGNRYSGKTLLGNLSGKEIKSLVDICRAEGIVLVAEKDDEIVGILAGKFFECEALGKFFEEIIWFVDENSRGVGLGLYKRILQLCKESGCNGISMTAYCNEHLDAVERLYLRSGFREIERKYYLNLKGE